MPRNGMTKMEESCFVDGEKFKRLMCPACGRPIWTYRLKSGVFPDGLVCCWCLHSFPMVPWEQVYMTFKDAETVVEAARLGL
jgi:hypothetical protein